MEEFSKNLQTSWNNWICEFKTYSLNLYVTIIAIILVLLSFTLNANRKVQEKYYISALEKKRNEVNSDLRGKSLTIIKHDMYIVLYPSDIEELNKQIATKKLYENEELVIKLNK